MLHEERIKERKALGLNRNEYQLYRVAYRKMKRQSDAKVNAEKPHLRVYQLYVHDNKKDNFALCNQWEKALLKQRDDTIDWMQDNAYMLEVMKELRANLEVYKERGKPTSVEDEDDYEMRFVQLLLDIKPVRSREVVGTH